MSITKMSVYIMIIAPILLPIMISLVVIAIKPLRKLVDKDAVAMFKVEAIGYLVYLIIVSFIANSILSSKTCIGELDRYYLDYGSGEYINGENELLGNKDIDYVVLDLGVNDSPYVSKMMYGTEHLFVIKYTKHVRSNSNVYSEVTDSLEDGIGNGFNSIEENEKDIEKDENSVEESVENEEVDENSTDNSEEAVNEDVEIEENNGDAVENESGINENSEEAFNIRDKNIELLRQPIIYGRLDLEKIKELEKDKEISVKKRI